MNAADRIYWLSTAWVLGAVLLYALGVGWAINHLKAHWCLQGFAESLAIYAASGALAGLIILKSDQRFYPEAHCRCYG